MKIKLKIPRKRMAEIRTGGLTEHVRMELFNVYMNMYDDVPLFSGRLSYVCMYVCTYLIIN